MAISAAIGEFAEILAQLEQTDKKVRSVALTGTDTDAEAVTARVEVGVPVIEGESVNDDVTIAATEIKLTDGYVDVTLEFSIPSSTGGVALGENRSRSLTGLEDTKTAESSNSAPPYKDPNALETVYEQHDSFSEMTAALGVDVTSETVRRYMVKHGIHDPGETGNGSADQSTDDGKNPRNDAAMSSNDNFPESSDGEYAAAQSDDEASAPSDGAVTESLSDETENPEYGDRSVAEILTQKDSKGDEPLIADGVGVPRDLTVSDLTKILNRSRTVSEVNRALDLDHDQTRRALNELGVIEFVTGRLADPRDDITIAEVERCIREENIL
ncbi:hypothetical protein [Natronococcus wangiae]|uniref:hypothetical protein n=1 Tax=Natronococcus wangiae TaxID=3068275 RepID=UPI00273E4DCA|nr:hypothetical protein [Natronococcus sp. AD5]